MGNPRSFTRDFNTRNRASASDPHCRIGKVRLKRRTRYRAAGQFDLTTNALRGFPSALLDSVSVR